MLSLKAYLKIRHLVAADVRRRIVCSNSRAPIRLLTSSATLFKQALKAEFQTPGRSRALPPKRRDSGGLESRLQAARRRLSVLPRERGTPNGGSARIAPSYSYQLLVIDAMQSGSSLSRVNLKEKEFSAHGPVFGARPSWPLRLGSSRMHVFGGRLFCIAAAAARMAALRFMASIYVRILVMFPTDEPARGVAHPKSDWTPLSLLRRN